MVDEYFEEFLHGEGFAPALDCRPVEAATLQHYRGRLPDRLLEYWQEFGFCGYAEGLFWTVNPADYAELLEMWLGDTELWQQEKFHVIARTAFGKLYALGEDSVDCAVINPHLSNVLPTDLPETPLTTELKNRKIGIFFEMSNKKYLDYADQNEKPLFARALQKLGPVSHDEMYSFVPALAAGGVADLGHLKIVGIQEQLAMLAELDTPLILPSVNQLFG